jgi:hypothetical protein
MAQPVTGSPKTRRIVEDQRRETAGYSHQAHGRAGGPGSGQGDRCRVRARRPRREDPGLPPGQGAQGGDRHLRRSRGRARRRARGPCRGVVSAGDRCRGHRPDRPARGRRARRTGLGRTVFLHGRARCPSGAHVVVDQGPDGHGSAVEEQRPRDRGADRPPARPLRDGHRRRRGLRGEHGRQVPLRTRSRPDARAVRRRDDRCEAWRHGARRIPGPGHFGQPGVRREDRRLRDHGPRDQGQEAARRRR